MQVGRGLLPCRFKHGARGEGAVWGEDLETESLKHTQTYKLKRGGEKGGEGGGDSLTLAALHNSFTEAASGIRAGCLKTSPVAFHPRA